MPVDKMCPDPNRVARLMAGDLPESEVDAICDHVSICPACTTILRNLSDDPTFPDSSPDLTHSWTDDPDDREEVERLILKWRGLPLPSGLSIGPLAHELSTESPHSSVNEQATELEGNVERDDEWIQLLSPAKSELELGWLGPYRVLGVLGSGGMGVVFEAEDQRLGRRVAIKAMQPNLRGREEHKLRFLREARSAASLDHDNIVPIHHVGEDRDVPFFVMPLLKGESLESRLRKEGRLSVAETVRIGKQIATGIAAAHDRGLIHRDIKPANIWLEARGQQLPRVKILDFGLARDEDDEAHLTRTGSIAGTPAYMAPEQARGDVTDARCDLFSLGCVLYCSLAGKPPFTGRNSAAMMFAIINHQPEPLHEIEPHLPDGLVSLVMHLLQKDPAQRIQSAQEVVQALQSLEEEASRTASANDSASNPHINQPALQPVSVKTEARNISSPSAGAHSRHRMITAAVAVVLMAFGAVYALSWVLKVQTPEGTVILTFEPDADGAAVSIDEKQRITVRFKPDGEPITLDVDPGKHKLKVSKPGFNLYAHDFTLSEGGRKELHVRLEPQNAEQAASSTVLPVPAALLEPTMWLRADRGAEPDAYGGVRTWTDQSSKGNHNASQEVVDSRPKLVPAVLNSLPVVKFDGNDSLNLSGQILQSQQFTIIAVTNYLSVKEMVGSRILISNWDDLRDHNSVFVGVMDIDGVFPRFTDELAGVADRNAAATVRALINNPERHFLFTARSSKADAEVFINTTRLIGTGRPLGKRDLAGTWRIGKQGPHFEYWSGELAEILVYDRALDDLELQAVWKHLNERYFQTKGPQPGNEPSVVPKVPSGTEQAKTGQPGTVPPSAVRSGLPASIPFPGLVPHPARVAGLRRWQIETLAPRGDIFAVACDRDGRRIACGSSIGNVRIIDVENSKTVCVIPAHTGTVWAMDWNSTEDRIVTAGDDGAVRLFDSTGKLLHELGSHAGTVRSVAFNRDGSWIASGGFDSKVRLWRATGEPGPVLSGHTSQVDGVAWHPSGKKLASASLDGTVRIWDLNGTWQTSSIRGHEVKGHLGGVLGLSWSPDGELLASAGVDGTILLSKGDGTQHSVLSGHGNVVTAISWGQTGLIATSGDDKTVRLWQRDGTLLKTQNLDAGRINDLEWSGDGSRLAIATGSQGIRLLNASGEWDGAISLDTSSMRALSFSNTGELATAGDGGVVGIWNADGTRKKQLNGHTKTAWSVNWNPAGDKLISGSWEMAVRMWDANGDSIGSRTGTNPTAWNPKGEEIAWTKGPDVQYEQPGSPARVLNGHKSQIIRLVWNGSGTQLASADVNGEIRVWNRDGSPAGLIQSDPMIMALAWHPNKSLLASGSAGNGNIQLWGTGGNLVKTWNGHMKGIIALDWNPTGERLTSSAYDQHVRIWNQEGNAVGELSGPMAIGCAAAWNATGQQIATAHIDGTLCLWDGNTYEPKSTSVIFNDGNWARFDANGLSSSSEPGSVDSRFIVVTEDQSGSIRLMPISEFRQGRPLPGN